MKKDVEQNINSAGYIKQKIIQLIAEHLEIERDEVKESSSFREDLSANSLMLVELLIILEENFYLPVISDTEAEKFITVRDVIDYVVRTTTSEDYNN